MGWRREEKNGQVEWKEEKDWKVRGDKDRGKGGTEGTKKDIYMVEEGRRREREECIVSWGEGGAITAVGS